MLRNPNPPTTTYFPSKPNTSRLKRTPHIAFFLEPLDLYVVLKTQETESARSIMRSIRKLSRSEEELPAGTKYSPKYYSQIVLQLCPSSRHSFRCQANEQVLFGGRGRLRMTAVLFAVVAFLMCKNDRVEEISWRCELYDAQC